MTSKGRGEGGCRDAGASGLIAAQLGVSASDCPQRRRRDGPLRRGGPAAAAPDPLLLVAGDVSQRWRGRRPYGRRSLRHVLAVGWPPAPHHHGGVPRGAAAGAGAAAGGLRGGQELHAASAARSIRLPKLVYVPRRALVPRTSARVSVSVTGGETDGSSNTQKLQADPNASLTNCSSFGKRLNAAKTPSS